MSEIFKTLSSIDVSSHSEKKQGLTYLSWTWAWAELVKVYPNATYEIKKNSNGLPFFVDTVGYMVFTSVTIENLTHEMFLPVMDNSNKAMKTEAIKDETERI